jgi:hypothetical protein
MIPKSGRARIAARLIKLSAIFKKANGGRVARSVNELQAWAGSAPGQAALTGHLDADGKIVTADRRKFNSTKLARAAKAAKPPAQAAADREKKERERYKGFLDNLSRTGFNVKKNVGN